MACPEDRYCEWKQLNRWVTTPSRGDKPGKGGYSTQIKQRHERATHDRRRESLPATGR
ncbi:protein of unknown function [Streptomyces sp. KY75]|nr:protein of unknown function [Streptomyces sp. KY75]CAD5989672.1 protein of unknown function [Streptomyces sp. KY70]